MPGDLRRITYQRDGFPIELVGEDDWRQAIVRRKITRETPVASYRDSQQVQHSAAGQLPELRLIFDDVEGVATESNPGAAGAHGGSV